MNTYIVIPAYNEEARIATVVQSCKKQCPDAHIVVVDDGSTDNTAMHAREGGAVVVAHAINRGQGAALATGNRWALDEGADAIVHFDGDDQFDARDISLALERLTRGECDMVLGSRFLPGAQHSRMPFFKRVLVKTVARWVNTLLTGVVLSDAHNGFRAMTGEAARRIVISHDGMSHNSEIIRQLRTKNIRFCEIPVSVRYHEYGQGLRGGLGIVKDMILSKFV